MDIGDKIKRVKRLLESNLSSRKALLLLIVVLGLILYTGPSVYRWVRHKTPIMIDPSIGCVALSVDPFLRDAANHDANVYRSYEGPSDRHLLSFVGNGKVGFSVVQDNTLFVLSNRTLSLPLPFHPGVEVIFPEGVSHQEGEVVHFVKGTYFRFQCFNRKRKTVSVSHTYYAHRTIPSLLVQNVRIVNPLSEPITLKVYQKGSTSEKLQAKPFGMQDRYGQDLVAWHGQVPSASRLVAFALITPRLPTSVTVEPKSSTSLKVQTLVHYSDPIGEDQYPSQVAALHEFLKHEMQEVVSIESHVLRNLHLNAWAQLWSSGFSISESKAEGALNGDKVNGTLYYLLSHAAQHSPRLLEETLAYPEHCYGGHRTLQASTLWGDLTNPVSVSNAVSLWMLTLENQGCSKLIRAGAEGMMQAVLLSLGAFLFKESHMELNAHPGDLHRELSFRRLCYGNATHLNVSVTLAPDNHALLRVALDRSDRHYYACDGGCLDPPVRLGFEVTQFPVKLTSPVTAVLYITADKQHMEELKHTIHVREVAEAPAHEHHVLALHRHGHQLGGLPALFWVSIAFLIVVFHLFLAKLIYNEYCGSGSTSSSDRNARSRYVP